jgi:DNA-binding MarR family transcriptional regulator
MTRKEDIARDAWRAVTEVMRSGRTAFPAVARHFDLTPGELRALLALDPDHPHPMRMLAGELRCDASNVTWLADRLEERRLVERRTDPTDRRVKTLALTGPGRTVRGKIADQLTVPPPALLHLSTAELRTLHQLLQKCLSAPDPTPTAD